VALGFKEHKFIEKVEICDITISGDKIDCENYEEVL
jgi:DNA-binding protein